MKKASARHRRRRRTSSASQAHPVAAELAPAARWVEEMQLHFQQHGYYRALDLKRLLGDPAGYVEGRTSAAFPVNFVSEKK